MDHLNLSCPDPHVAYVPVFAGPHRIMQAGNLGDQIIEVSETVVWGDSAFAIEGSGEINWESAPEVVTVDGC